MNRLIVQKQRERGTRIPESPKKSSGQGEYSQKMKEELKQHARNETMKLSPVFLSAHRMRFSVLGEQEKE